MKTLAADVDKQIREFCFNAFLLPTLHLHTTHWGIVNESDVGESGKLRFSSARVQEEAAQRAFEQSFILLMQAMASLDRLFQLNMAEALQVQGRNWINALA